MDFVHRNRTIIRMTTTSLIITSNLSTVRYNTFFTFTILTTDTGEFFTQYMDHGNSRFPSVVPLSYVATHGRRKPLYNTFSPGFLLVYQTKRSSLLS